MLNLIKLASKVNNKGKLKQGQTSGDNTSIKNKFEFNYKIGYIPKFVANDKLAWDKLYLDIASKIRNWIKTDILENEYDIDLDGMFKIIPDIIPRTMVFREFTSEILERYYMEQLWITIDLSEKAKNKYEYIQDIVVDWLKRYVDKSIDRQATKEKIKLLANMSSDERKLICFSRTKHSIIIYSSKTNKLLFNLEAKKYWWKWGIISQLNLRVWSFQHLFAYYQFMALLYKMLNNKNIKILTIKDKEYSVDETFRKIFRHLVISATTDYYIDGAFNSQNNVFLKEKSGINKLIKQVKFTTNDNWTILINKDFEDLWFYLSDFIVAVIKKLYNNWYFTREYVDSFKKNWNRKEYAKVYQTNNLRVNNQTDEIIKDLLNKVKPEVRKFIQNFKMFEIDERTNVDELTSFFETYYKVYNFIWRKLDLDYSNLVWDISLKVRMLWQYKATWVYFPNEKLLSVDTRTWQALIHETGHFIHHILAEKQPNKKQEILSIMNRMDDLINKWYFESYPALTLYAFTLTNANKLDTARNKTANTKFRARLLDYLDFRKIYEYTNLINKKYQELKWFFTGKHWYANYAWTSKEIFARLFDYSITTLLEKEEPEIAKDIALIWTKTVYTRHKADDAIEQLDLYVMEQMKKQFGYTKEQLYKEFIDFIKKELK